MDLEAIINHLAAEGQQRLKPSQKLLAGPACIEAAGGLWCFGSDCRSIVFAGQGLFRSFKTSTPLLMKHEYPKNHDLISSLLDPSLKVGEMTAFVRELKAFCGKAVWSQRCPACKGTSKGSDYVDCGWCDCEGIVGAKVKPGVILGRCIDLSRVAQVLEAFQGDLVTLFASRTEAVPKDRQGDMLCLRAFDLCAVVMCLEPPEDAEEALALPQFPKPEVMDP